MVYAVVDLSNPFINPAARFGNVGTFVNIILPLLSAGAALLFLGMLFYGAFQWITAGGSPDNVAKAQKTITFAVVGMFVIFLSYLLVKLIGTVLHVDMPL